MTSLKTMLRIPTTVFLLLTIFEASLQIAAANANTTATVTMQPGIFAVSSTPSISFGTIASIMKVQSVTALIDSIKINDFRGTGRGWSVSIAATHMGIRGEYAPVKKTASGNGSTVSPSDLQIRGTYNGLNHQNSYNGIDGIVSGDFYVKVTGVTGSPPSPSEILITKPDATESVLRVVNNTLSFNGLEISFKKGNTFTIDDQFGITVDHFTYTKTKVTPFDLVNGSSSSLVGIEVNVSGNLFGNSDTSAKRPEVFTTPIYGMGEYFFKNTIEWTIHAKPLPGLYQSIITYSIV